MADHNILLITAEYNEISNIITHCDINVHTITVSFIWAYFI